MIIKSNASRAELSSPFYKINENFCAQFETYITSKKGMVKGNYNAWSFIVFGKFEDLMSWDLMYKKATYTSSGNLLLSSKSQSLLTMAIWKTKLLENKDANLIIRRKKTFDFIKMFFNRKIKNIGQTHNYIYVSDDRMSKKMNDIIEVLNPLFINKNIYKIQLKNDDLIIELRSEEHHFDILEKLLKKAF